MILPDADAALADLARVVRGVDGAETVAFTAALAEARGVWVAGSGRSGFIGRAFAMRLAQMGRRAFFVGDATTPAIAAGDLLVVCSGSGATEAMIGVGGRALHAGARLALVTAAIIAPLTQMAHVRVRLPTLLPAGVARVPDSAPPTGRGLFPPMRTLFEQALLVYLDLVIVALMQRLGISAEDMEARHANLE